MISGCQLIPLVPGFRYRDDLKPETPDNAATPDVVGGDDDTSVVADALLDGVLVPIPLIVDTL